MSFMIPHRKKKTTIPDFLVLAKPWLPKHVDFQHLLNSNHAFQQATRAAYKKHLKDLSFVLNLLFHRCNNRDAGVEKEKLSRGLFEMYDFISSKPNVLTQNFDGGDVVALIDYKLINQPNNPVKVDDGYFMLRDVMEENKSMVFIFERIVGLFDDGEVNGLVEHVEEKVEKEKQVICLDGNVAVGTGSFVRKRNRNEGAVIELGENFFWTSLTI